MLQLAGSAANTINSRFIKYYDNASLLLNRYFQPLIRFLNLQLDYRQKE